MVDDNDEKSKYRRINEQIMSKYRNNSKIKYIKHKKNLNGAVARNTGISNSTSKYIAFLDDDDEFLEKKIELQIKLLEQLDNIWGAVYCGHSIYKNNKIVSKYLNLRSGNLRNELLLLDNSIASGSTMLIKREILNELNGFDVTFLRHQDWELLMRLFRKYKLAYVNRVLVKIHIDDRQNIIDPEKLVLVKEKFLKKYKKDIEEMPIGLQKEVYKRHYLEITRTFIKNKRMKRAVEYYEKSKYYCRITSLDHINLLLAMIDSIIPIRNFLSSILLRFSRNYYTNIL